MGFSLLFAALTTLFPLVSAGGRQVAIFSRMHWKEIISVEIKLQGRTPVKLFDKVRGKKPWAYVIDSTEQFEHFELKALHVDGFEFEGVYAVKGTENAKMVRLHDGNDDKAYPSIFVLETHKVYHDQDMWSAFAKKEVFRRVLAETVRTMERNLPKYWSHFQLTHSGTSLFIMGDGFAQPDDSKDWLKNNLLRFKYSPDRGGKSYHARRFDGPGCFSRISVKRESGRFSVKHRNLEGWTSEIVHVKLKSNDLKITTINIPVPTVLSDVESADQEIVPDVAASGDHPRILIIPFTSNKISDVFWNEVETSKKVKYWVGSRWNLPEIEKLWKRLREQEPENALDNLAEVSDGDAKYDQNDNRKMKLVVLGVVVLLVLCSGCAYYVCCPSDAEGSHSDCSSGAAETSQAEIGLAAAVDPSAAQ